MTAPVNGKTHYHGKISHLSVVVFVTALKVAIEMFEDSQERKAVLWE